MRFTQALLVVFLLLPSASVQSQQGVPAESFFAPRVSPIHLISHPEKYHGKRVKVFGYLHVRFEDSALYLSKDDADYLTGANAIWVSYDSTRRLYPIEGKEVTGGTIDDLKYFDGRYVMLEGFFNMNERGHMGSFSGGLERVMSIIESRRWYDGRKELAKQDSEGRIVPKRRHR